MKEMKLIPEANQVERMFAHLDPMIDQANADCEKEFAGEEAEIDFWDKFTNSLPLTKAQRKAATKFMMAWILLRDAEIWHYKAHRQIELMRAERNKTLKAFEHAMGITRKPEAHQGKRA